MNKDIEIRIVDTEYDHSPLILKDTFVNQYIMVVIVVEIMLSI